MFHGDNCERYYFHCWPFKGPFLELNCYGFGTSPIFILFQLLQLARLPQTFPYKRDTPVFSTTSASTSTTITHPEDGSSMCHRNVGTLILQATWRRKEDYQLYMTMVVLWNVTIYWLVEIYRRFGRTCLHLRVAKNDLLKMENTFLPKVEEFIPLHTVSYPGRR